MPGRAKACVERLSEDEQASLRKLCGRARGADIPGDHALKLIDLGLAEVSCGDLGATSAGRIAMAAENGGR